MIPLADLRAYVFLSALMNDEHEPYYPADGMYYSSCDYFRRSSLGEAKAWWRKTVRLMRAGRAPRDLGLYVHWPFCPGRCGFCFCSMAVPKGCGEMEACARSLEREMEAFRDVFRGAEFNSVYFGGGTPTFLPGSVLDRLLGRMETCFRIAEGAEIYVEASPATLSEEKLDVLLKHGVNRVTVGVQSLDAGVLSNGKRRQKLRDVERALKLLSIAPGVYSGAELMFGLEGQTARSFLQDVASVMKMGPHGVYLYGFDPRPQTPFARSGKRQPDSVRKNRAQVMQVLDRMARVYGYRPPSHHPDAPAYMRTISAQCRTARHRGGSILGLGPSSLSHAFGSAWYRHPPVEELARRWGGPPPIRGLESPIEEEMRAYCVRHLYTQGELSRKGFRSVFGKDLMKVPFLAKGIRDLEADGKVRTGKDLISFRSRDRALRVVYSKRLYSPGLLKRILSAHRKEYKAFLRKHPDAEVRRLEPAADRRVAALMTTFEKRDVSVPAWARVKRLEAVLGRR